MQNEWIVGHEYNWHQIPIKRGEKTNHVVSRPLSFQKTQPWSEHSGLTENQVQVKIRRELEKYWMKVWKCAKLNDHQHIVEMHTGQLPEAVLLANASTPSCIKIAFSIWVCRRRAVTRIMWMKIHANGRDIFSLLLSGVIWKYMLWHQKTRWILGDVHISCQPGEVTEGGKPPNMWTTYFFKVDAHWWE